MPQLKTIFLVNFESLTQLSFNIEMNTLEQHPTLNNFLTDIVLKNEEDLIEMPKQYFFNKYQTKFNGELKILEFYRIIDIFISKKKRKREDLIGQMIIINVKLMRYCLKRYLKDKEELEQKAIKTNIEFECSVCYETTSNQFNSKNENCNKHTEKICNKCSSKLDKCPICRFPFVNKTRIFDIPILEQIN